MDRDEQLTVPEPTSNESEVDWWVLAAGFSGAIRLAVNSFTGAHAATLRARHSRERVSAGVARRVLARRQAARTRRRSADSSSPTGPTFMRREPRHCRFS
jgi:hypothetical protein